MGEEESGRGQSRRLRRLLRCEKGEGKRIMEKTSIVCDEDGDDGDDQPARSQSVATTSASLRSITCKCLTLFAGGAPLVLYPLDGVKGDAS